MNKEIVQAMNWSGKRKSFKSMLCPELSKRVDIYVTSYRGAHDDVGEAWITLDGEKVFGAGYYKKLNARYTHDEVAEQDVYDEEEFIRAVEEYLTCNIDEALHSEDDLIRAFAMLDRRLGRRRLRQLDIDLEDAQIVKLCHAIRMSVM
ncbi:MAG: hypothetical protein IPG61_08370 [bacterium]|nr:hypothetical protein [bacterium]